MIAMIFYLIIAAFALYVLLPFFDRNFRKRQIPLESAEQAELLLRKDEILAGINDLEYDFRMKKITEPDYLQLKEKMTQDFINIQKKLDQFTGSSGNHHAAGLEDRKRHTQHIGS